MSNHPAEWWEAKRTYDTAKAKVKEYTDRGRDPGGFARDLQEAADRWREVGGLPD